MTEYAPLTRCAICGHIRNDHELIERQWCGRCASGGRSREAWHTFEPAESVPVTERLESELRIWAEERSRRGWGPAFKPPYVWRDDYPEVSS